MVAVLRAFAGYFFLVFLVRVAGRRPGNQITPVEFVLIFFIGGLTLTAMVGNEVSFTNALCQIISVAAGHYAITWLRCRSSRFARLTDGTPLVLLEKGRWRTTTMQQMRVSPDDVIASARAKGMKTISGIDTAVLERNGEISLSSKQK